MSRHDDALYLFYMDQAVGKIVRRINGVIREQFDDDDLL